MSDRARPPRVLFVCGSDFSSPSEKQVLWFCRELCSQGGEAMISVMGDRSTAAAEGADRIDGLSLLWPRFRGRRPAGADLETVRSFAPDLIHAFYARAAVIAAARAYTAVTGSRVFVHWEDDEWGLRGGFPTRSPLRRLARAARRGGAAVHPPLWYQATRGSLRWATRNAVAHDAVTPTLRGYVEERLGQPCEVLLPAMAPPGAVTGASPELPRRVRSGRIVSYTGQIHPARVEDVALAARAVALVQRCGLDATFVHAGGNIAGIDTDELAARAGLQEGTYEFTGHLPYSRIPPLLAESAALIQSNRPIRFNMMGLPSKLQGYLASGKPVLASAAGAGELLRDRDEVLKTHTGDPGELADRLREVLTDDALRRTLSAGGPRAAARLFDPGRTTAALLAHYRRHLGTGADR